MSLLETVYSELREQNVNPLTAVDLCGGLRRMNRAQQWVFLRKVQGFTQEEIGQEMRCRQQRISETINGPLHVLASILAYSQA